MTTCKYDKAWIGPCGEETDGGFCSEHSGLLCASCGAAATHECDHTGSQFVCGYPLCDECEHGIPSGSFFGLGGGHKRKVTKTC